jgi:hypothetical protein
MKVKIDNSIYDANEQPIMLIFNSEEEINTIVNHLSNMKKEARKYCMFPEGFDVKEIKNFMKI